MKIFKFLAAATLSLGMLNFVSCSSKSESLCNDISEEYEEAAEILQGECLSWEDTQDVATDLNKIADNLYDISKKAEKNAIKMKEELESMTKKENKELDEKLEAKMKAAREKWNDAVEAFTKREAVKDSEAVKNAIKRINSSGRF